MEVSELIDWLGNVPQDEEVKWEQRSGGMIALLIHDKDDPHDDYESDAIFPK